MDQKRTEQKHETPNFNSSAVRENNSTESEATLSFAMRSILQNATKTAGSTNAAAAEVSGEAAQYPVLFEQSSTSSHFLIATVAILSSSAKFNPTETLDERNETQELKVQSRVCMRCIGSSAFEFNTCKQSFYSIETSEAHQRIRWNHSK